MNPKQVHPEKSCIPESVRVGAPAGSQLKTQVATPKSIHAPGRPEAGAPWTVSRRIDLQGVRPGLPCLLALGFALALAAIETTRAAEAVVAPGVRSVNLAASPLVRRTAGGERGAVTVAIDSDGLSDVAVQLTSPGWSGPFQASAPKLGQGTQSLDVETPALTEAVPVSVHLQAAGFQQAFGPFTVEPPRHWTVYLTQHTHTDIGYTRPQTEILPEHLRYIDYALDYCDLTDGYPDDARFRWTCETSWAVRQYLQDRPARQIERLKKRVREGRIEMCGLMLNMSEIAPEQALAALVQPLREMKERFGFPIRTAMQNDVNGAGWCLPDYFSGIGIRYLTMGINKPGRSCRSTSRRAFGGNRPPANGSWPTVPTTT